MFGFLCLLFCSCGSSDLESNFDKPTSDSLAVESIIAEGEVQIVEPVIDDEGIILKKDGITLTEIKTENKIEASIQLYTKKFAAGKNHLCFSVSGVQNYSIAYLANNYALSQFSSDIFNVELMYGNNVFLAFLTDKNGISIKTNKGSVLRNAVLGGVESVFDMKHSHLFYHLPLEETSDPILDFYLVNTAVSEKGNKVKVTINDKVVATLGKGKIFGERALFTSGNEDSIRSASVVAVEETEVLILTCEEFQQLITSGDLDEKCVEHLRHVGDAYVYK